MNGCRFFNYLKLNAFFNFFHNDFMEIHVLLLLLLLLLFVVGVFDLIQISSIWLYFIIIIKLEKNLK